jgi:hypothetical protein
MGYAQVTRELLRRYRSGSFCAAMMCLLQIKDYISLLVILLSLSLRRNLASLLADIHSSSMNIAINSHRLIS